MRKVIRKTLIYSIILILILVALFLYLYTNNNINTTLLDADLNVIQIYDSDSNLITKANINAKNIITYNDIPQHTIDAFVTTEDKQFFQHKGLNYIRIVKAMFKNIISGYSREGASTITQQLVKNTHLSSEKTLKRKIKEAILALKVERTYTKEQILTLYLNMLYFGNSYYGIQDASIGYFGHDATELTIAESATLAGIIKSPATYSPITNTENCINRRNYILKLMLDENKINKQEYNNAINSDLTITNTSNSITPYTQLVIKELNNNIDIQSVNTFPLKVITYLNSTYQNILYNNQISDIDYNSTLLVNNKTNSVIACCGNCINLKRQCGSLIKPILCYAPAFEYNIISPATQILDEYTNFGDYSPKNISNKYYGWISARYALAKSLNIPAIKILDYVGLDKAIQFATNFGLDFNELDNHLAIALGATSNGYDIKQITDAYSTFANNGYYTESKTIRNVLYKNKLVYKNTTELENICRNDTAYLINDILKDCTKYGTAKQISNLSNIIASKTGTVGTNNSTNTDAWCVCYCPEFTITTWCGNPTGNMNQNLKSNQNGGTICTNTNYNIIKELLQLINITDFQQPNTIIKKNIDSKTLKQNHIIKLTNTTSNLTDYFSIHNIPNYVNTIDNTINNSQNTKNHLTNSMGEIWFYKRR